jgi:hypothetical protein
MTVGIFEAPEIVSCAGNLIIDVVKRIESEKSEKYLVTALIPGLCPGSKMLCRKPIRTINRGDRRQVSPIGNPAVRSANIKSEHDLAPGSTVSLARGGHGRETRGVGGGDAKQPIRIQIGLAV